MHFSYEYGYNVSTSKGHGFLSHHVVPPETVAESSTERHDHGHDRLPDMQQDISLRPQPQQLDSSEDSARKLLFAGASLAIFAFHEQNSPWSHAI